ncbi:RHS repeat-associated core domain-containing protein [Loktanella sp. IMCC34160]|uniref:RHS repeat-associated core domain-containing protein n=1 Tax=Loktanella sp. IMCC34160 TaxID=2510646 RepID=UPI0013EA734E|nr:RHS repeat-associated core domain-containing protein [Loktanella sp. IMCC34160]
MIQVAPADQGQPSDRSDQGNPASDASDGRSDVAGEVADGEALENADEASALAEEEEKVDSAVAYSIEADPAEEFTPAEYRPNLPDEIQSDGAFRYRVPIAMPQYQGFEPQLALVYNSSQKGYAGDGPILGTGWTLSGLSQIRRVTLGGGIASFIDEQDIYTLDGEDLLACADSSASVPYAGTYPASHLTTISSSSCVAGGQFVTLIDDGRRVVQTTDANGHLSFEVTNRDGVISTYRSVGSLANWTPSVPASTETTTCSSGPGYNGGCTTSGSTTVGEDPSEVAFGRIFLISEIRDQQAIPNTVLITYDIDTANGFAAVPASVTYAGYSVDLHYRLEASHLRSFATGHADHFGYEHRVLEAVTVSDGATGIRAYDLTFGSSPHFGRIRVDSVTEYGRDFALQTDGSVTGSALPPVTFTYNDDTPGFETVAVPIPPADTHFDNYAIGHTRLGYLADLNEDGGVDLIFQTEAPHGWNGGDGSGSWGGGGSGDPVEASAAYSVDQDRTVTPVEVLLPYFEHGSSTRVPLASINGPDSSTGQTLFAERVRVNSIDKTVRELFGPTGQEVDQFASYADTLHFIQLNLDRDPGQEALLKVRNTSAVPQGSYDVGPSGYVSSTHDVSGLTYDLDTTSQQRIGYVVGDFDGNGLSDVAVHNRLYLYFPDGFREFPISIDNYVSSGPRADLRAADMNGDGLDDIVFLGKGDQDSLVDASAPREFAIYYATGRGFLPRETVLYQPEDTYGPSDLIPAGMPNVQWEGGYQLTDMNGDGLVDVIMTKVQNSDDLVDRDAFSAVILYWNGARFEVADDPEAYLTNIISGAQLFGDFDGDGLTDIFDNNVVDTTGSYTGPAFAPGEQIHFGAGGIPNIMTSVDTPTGAVASVSYAPSSDGVGPDSVVLGDQIPGIRQVVSAVTVDDGFGNLATTSYRYRDSRYDHARQRSLGFEQVQVILPAVEGETDPLVRETTYLNSDFVLSGSPAQEMLWLGDQILTETSNSYLTRGAGNGPFRAQLISSTSRTRSGDGADDFVETSREIGYDAWGRVAWELDLGMTLNGVDIDTSGAGNVLVQTQYAASFSQGYFMNLPCIRTSYRGNTITNDPADWLDKRIFIYDELGGCAEPTSGNLTYERFWGGDPTSNLVNWRDHRRTYDTHGNLLTDLDPELNLTSFGYDPVRHLFRTSVTNALGHQASVTWDEACQLPTGFTDPNGLTTTRVYDAHCRAVSQTAPNGHATNVAYLDFGDPGLQRVETTSASASSLPNAEQTISVQYFDGLGRATRTEASGRTSLAADRTYARTSYDARGRAVAQSLPLTHAESQLATLPDTLLIRTTYDALDRPLSVTNADGSRSEMQYGIRMLPVGAGEDGASLSLSARFAMTTRFDEHCFDDVAANTDCHPVSEVADHRGNRIRMILNDPGTDTDAAAGERITEFRYGAKGQLIGVTDPRGANWVYTYDVSGNRISADDAGLGLWTMQYDRNGNLTRQTDAKGQVITFSYDALNRPLTKTVAWDGQQDVITYTYDQPRAGSYNIGQLTTLTNAVHQVKYDYNDQGQPWRTRHWVDQTGGAADVEFETSFWPNGLPRNQAMPLTSGAPNTWVGELSYDAAGRMIGFGSYITDVDYGRWGGAIRTDYGNGLTELRSYRDTRGWIDAIRVEDSTGTELHPDTVYWRSATGRVTRVQGIAAPGGFDYTYDYAGRLLSAINHAGASQHDQSFAYDSAGSMTFNSRLGTYVYPSAMASHPHAPDTVAGQVFAYDANGNMTTGLNGKTMSYDGENRPLMVETSVENGGIRTEYVYGADGSRLKLIDAVGTGNEATTLYLGVLEVRGFGSGADTIVAYPHSDLRIVGNDTSYLHRDQLASVQVISNGAGQRATRRQYRPFGEISWEVIEQVTADEAHGFIGERFDEGAGLQYLNARYYDPELGLFLQPDWFEVTKAGVGTNRYAYSFNDPVNARDPGGNEADGDDDSSSQLRRWREWLQARRYERNLRELERAQAELERFVNAVRNGEYDNLSDLAIAEAAEARFRLVDQYAAYVEGGLGAEAVDYGIMALSLGGLKMGAGASQATRGVVAPSGTAAPLVGAANGAAGETTLAILLGGAGRAQAMTTPLGRRVIDRLAFGVAHESKVGYTSASAFVRNQALKDGFLLANREVEGVVWHFFRSPTTGAGGPSGPLRELLQSQGIAIRIHSGL